MVGDAYSPFIGGQHEDILSRRRYLIDSIQAGNASVAKMPGYLSEQFQGEWAIVSNSMLASALTNIAFLAPETREESLSVIASLITATLSPSIRNFDHARWGEDPLESLPGNKGHIGYLGHLNWMIGAFRFAGGDRRFDELHRNVSESLRRRLRESPEYCLQTYPGEPAYVADNVVVVASLANFALLNHGEGSAEVGQWITSARAKLPDAKLGLLPFYLDDTCHPIEGVRGSAAGWNSFFLPFIEPAFASQQFTLLKQHLLQTRLITGVREYPRDVGKFGDVDSGPVLFGFSPAATGFAIAGAIHAVDPQLVSKLLFTAELAGSSVQWNGRRHYILAPLVGEAILLAMKTAMLWDTRYLQPSH